MQLWWCGRAGQEADGTGAAADRRRNVRWERLSEVLRDLEELRGVGERLLTANRRARLSRRGSRAVAMPKGRSSNEPSKGASRVAAQVDEPARSGRGTTRRSARASG